MKKIRTLFLSDIHLGSRHCKADLLLQFLKDFEFDNLVLVGDIIDIWALSKKWYWPASHSTVLQKILRLSRKGINVYYIVGNHDEFLRKLLPVNFGGIEVVQDLKYTLANGKSILCIHGDIFDFIISNKYTYFLGHVGTWAFEALGNIYLMVSKLRGKLGIQGQNLSYSMSHEKLNESDETYSRFEHSALTEAISTKVDGIITGHTHIPKLINKNGVIFGNCGDWVESYSGIIEHKDGNLELVRYSK